MSELCDRIIRVAQCITNEILVNNWQETEYCLHMCCATNDAIIEIYCAHNKLCEVQCLKMYWTLKYMLWFKIYNVPYYHHLRLDTCICTMY
jgi:hypothetical protein